MPLRRLLAAALLLACGASQAALLCEAAPCRVELEFAEGGAIEAPAGATISFGAGGLLDLGSGGSIDYGSGGNAEPATPGSAVPDLSAGGSIRLGPGGSIHFGNGGRLLGGDTAQVEAPDGSAVEFLGAQRVEIGSEAAVHVGRLRQFGQVLIEAREVDVGNHPAPFRFGGTDSSLFELRTTDKAWVESLGDEGDANGSVAINSTEPAEVNPGAGGGTGSGSGLTVVGSPGATGSTEPPPPPAMTGGDISLGGASTDVTIEPAGGTASPGTISAESPNPLSVAAIDDGRGGGAFPGLLLALFAALGLARRLRR